MIKAFPTAKGFAENTTGGRGGTVIKVTNLNDSGSGSLREACEASGARYIVFEVSGNIELNTSIIITEPDCTILGQTAPGDGVCVTAAIPFSESSTLFRTSAANIIIRFLRVRRQGEQTPTFYMNDSCLTFGEANGLVLDHCSVSYSSDDNVGGGNSVAQNITIQNSMIYDPVPKYYGSGGVVEPQTGINTKGLLFYNNANNISIIQNVFAHIGQRQPAVVAWSSDIDVEVVNNIIYNRDGFGMSFSQEGSLTGVTNANVISNKIIAGNDTITTRYDIGVESGTNHKIYADNNITYQRPSDTQDEWDCIGSGSNYTTPAPTSFQSLTPFSFPTLDAIEVNDLETELLSNAGATYPNRDTADGRIINDIETRTGTNINEDVITKPFAPPYLLPTLSGGSIPVDSNNNGIPDDFENMYMNGAGANDIAPSGYPWIEEYFNYLVGEANPQPPTPGEGNIRNIRDTRKILFLS